MTNNSWKEVNLLEQQTPEENANNKKVKRHSNLSTRKDTYVHHTKGYASGVDYSQDHRDEIIIIDNGDKTVNRYLHDTFHLVDGDLTWENIKAAVGNLEVYKWNGSEYVLTKVKDL